MSEILTGDRADAAGSKDSRAIENFDAIVKRILPLERLERDKHRLRQSFEQAKPFPHLVIDGLWDPEVLDRIIAEFPQQGERDWLSYDTQNELKQTSRGLFGLSPFTQLFLMEVCSPRFLSLLGEVTGFSDLIADPLFHGGGLHESFRGGWLNVHADWRQHPVLPLARRANMIIYLNKDWDPAWGGGIELWNPGDKEASAKADCLYNRTLIFPTTDTTLHGFPAPMTCPPDRSRKSVSLFYWTMDESAVKTAQNINFLPGKRQTRVKALVHSIVPPIVFDTKTKILRALGK